MVKLPIMCVMGKNVSQVLNGDRLTDTMKKRWVNVMGFSFVAEKQESEIISKYTVG